MTTVPRHDDAGREQVHATYGANPTATTATAGRTR